MKAELHLKLSLVVSILLTLVTLLIALAVCAMLIQPANEIVQGVLLQFSLSSERSPPAFFSFLLLPICGFWLGVIALHERQSGSRWWRYWAFLAAMFVLMSYDEAAGMHEKLIEPLRDALHIGGFFYYAWVIPGMIVVALIFVAYLPFLLHLPPLFRWLFMLSGAIYVGGAIGIEMISGKYFDEYGRDLIYRMIATVEESFEMFGAVLFIYSLMRYATRQTGSFALKLELTAGMPIAQLVRAPALAALAPQLQAGDGNGAILTSLGADLSVSVAAGAGVRLGEQGVAALAVRVEGVNGSGPEAPSAEVLAQIQPDPLERAQPGE